MGTFNGDGFTISGLNVVQDYDNQGLFGAIGANSIIKNVGLINININGRNNVGGIAGSNIGGKIENCYVNGNVNVNGINNVGGIVGHNAYDNTAGIYSRGDIRNCYTTGNIEGTGDNIGGIAGFNDNKDILNCYSLAIVSGNNAVGGIVGGAFGVIYNNVALNPRVIGTASSTNRIVGTLNGSATNNFARADMLVNNNTRTSNNANSIDGADINSTEWNSANWWQTTANFDPNIWVLADGNLPILQFPGERPAQNPMVQ